MKINRGFTANKSPQKTLLLQLNHSNHKSTMVFLH